MWVTSKLFYKLLDDNAAQAKTIIHVSSQQIGAEGQTRSYQAQKIKDDLMLDWLRHRVNALEKERVLYLQKITGVSLPVPELTPTLPTIGASYDSSMFDDMGDEQAKAQGVVHDGAGELVYMK